MNPFLQNPVAQALDEQDLQHWRAPTPVLPVNGARALARQVGVAAIATGLAVGFSAYAIDVNVASVSQLESLRGIGPRTAKMIVHERSRAGAFASMEDLSDRVRGLGQRRVRALQAAGLEVGAANVGQDGRVLSIVEQTPQPQKKPKRQSSVPTVRPEVVSSPPF
jgi:competence protein ComEA